MTRLAKVIEVEWKANPALQGKLRRVREARAKWKRSKGMVPTRRQADLLGYIVTRSRRGGIPFEETVYLNWSILGGLFARGLVIWQKAAGGFSLVAAP